MKKRSCLIMLAVCLSLSMTACTGAGDADRSKTEQSAENKGAEVGTSRIVSVEDVEKYITIGTYKGLELDNAVEVITDEDVQIQIEARLQDKADVVSAGAQIGDLVTINYVGTIDGKTFDGGTANNYDFVVGDGFMFQEFEDGVLDMKKGDTKEITIDFSSDYGDPVVAGKQAVYKVTVQNVRRAPELTDKWVTKNTDYTTVEDYRESIREELEEEAKSSAQETMKNTAWDLVLESSEILEYPEKDIENAIAAFKDSMQLYADQAEMTLDELVESQGISQDEFEEQCLQYAQGKVKQNLIIQGIMDAEGLSLDDKESLKIQERLVELMGAGDIAELVDIYGQDYVNESIALLRVEDFMVENAKISQKAAAGDTIAEDAEAAVKDQSVQTDFEDVEESADSDLGIDEELENELGTEESADITQ